MNTQNAPEALLSSIQEEVALVLHFIQILEKEAQILESGQPDELVVCSEKKAASAAQITEASNARDSLLVSMGYPSGTQGLAQAAQDYPAVSVELDKLLDLAVTAKRNNESNGVTISLLLQQNTLLLETLQRLSSSGEVSPTEVYDASGKSKTVALTPNQPRLKPVKAG